MKIYTYPRNILMFYMFRPGMSQEPLDPGTGRALHACRQHNNDAKSNNLNKLFRIQNFDKTVFANYKIRLFNRWKTV